MTKEKKLTEIILYHGTLDELNSRDPEKKFIFHKGSLYFASNNYDLHQKPYAAIKEELREFGCDGLVNVRPNVFQISEENNNLYLRLEGTPIVRVEKEKSQ